MFRGQWCGTTTIGVFRCQTVNVLYINTSTYLVYTWRKPNIQGCQTLPLSYCTPPRSVPTPPSSTAQCGSNHRYCTTDDQVQSNLQLEKKITFVIIQQHSILWSTQKYVRKLGQSTRMIKTFPLRSEVFFSGVTEALGLVKCCSVSTSKSSTH